MHRIVRRIARALAVLASAGAVMALAQTPTVTTSGGTTPFVQGTYGASTPVVIDAAVTVTDSSSTTLQSATVSITGSFGAGDTLGFVDQNGISASYNSGIGVLTLFGPASLANYQTALQSITYTTTALALSTATRTISFTVNDGTSSSSAASKAVSVTASTPTVTTSPGTTPFVSTGVSSPPVVIDAALTVTDTGTTTLTGATVSISTNFAVGDILGFTSQNGITSSYNSGTGVLALNGPASLAFYQIALQSVTYTSTAASPSTATRTISFTATDAVKTSAAATKAVSVADNQAPVVTTSTGSAAFVAGGAAVFVDPGLSVSDADSATLASATASITANLHSAEDVLGFVNTSAATFGNITGSYNTTTGVLVLSSSGATATVAQWQSALESVTYNDIAGSPNTATRVVAFTASDGLATSSAASRSVTVTLPLSQTITFANPGSQNFGTSPTLTATASSGLAVTFTSSTPVVCTITSGGVLTTVSVGGCTINVDQGGNGTFAAAPQVSRSFSILAVVPGAPTIGIATAGDAQASVTFSAPAFTGGAAITGYTATSNPGGFTGTCASSPCTVTGLANGTAYTFTVKATNSAGPGPASAASNSVTPKGAQTITFTNPGSQGFGTTPTLGATASSGLAVTFTSSTASVCTITSGGVLTTVSVGLCTINADQAGNGTYLAAPQVSQSFAIGVVTTFTGPSATGNGTITASFTGGGASCTFSRAAFIALSAVPAAPPGAVSFPDGLFDFATIGCTHGSTLAFTIVYPAALPAGAVYMKYGPTAVNHAPHWYQLPAAISGNTATFSITDGGQGDDDLAQDGAVVDQGGPGIPGVSSSGEPVPTLSDLMMALLGFLVLLLGAGRLSRRSA